MRRAVGGWCNQPATEMSTVIGGVVRLRGVVLGAALAAVVALTGVPALADDGDQMAAEKYGDRRPEDRQVSDKKQAASPQASTGLAGPTTAVTVAKLTGQQSINATDSRYAVFGRPRRHLGQRQGPDPHGLR